MVYKYGVQAIYNASVFTGVIKPHSGMCMQLTPTRSLVYLELYRVRPSTIPDQYINTFIRLLSGSRGYGVCVCVCGGGWVGGWGTLYGYGSGGCMVK